MDRTERHKRHGFYPWVRKISWRRKWQPTPVFLPGKYPWIEEPGGLQSIDSPRVRQDWSNLAHTHIASHHLWTFFGCYISLWFYLPPLRGIWSFRQGKPTHYPQGAYLFLCTWSFLTEIPYLFVPHFPQDTQLTCLLKPCKAHALLPGIPFHANILTTLYCKNWFAYKVLLGFATRARFAFLCSLPLPVNITDIQQMLINE